MSVWKKAAKAHQKTHRERHQPEVRQHLGLLEKKKDYVKRARDYNEKKETLKVLHKRALNKNPDEFYHHMINSKVEDGMHFEKETEAEDTPEQIKLMLTQDLKYIIMKRTQEMKKIEKLQAQLHLSSIDHQVKNKHIYFDKKVDREELDKQKNELLSQVKLPDLSPGELEKLTNATRSKYNELAKRIKREQELALIQQKIEMKRHLKDTRTALKPKRLKKGDTTSAPIYKWKYERKK